MATRLAKSQEATNFLVHSSEIQDASWPGAEALGEQFPVPPVSYCNDSLLFSPVDNSTNQSRAPSFMKTSKLSSISSMADDVDGISSPILSRGELEQSAPSPSSPPALFNDNSFNSSSRWSFDEIRSFSVTSMDNQETRPLSAGAGLANLGNTCFINAVLQCFTHTAPFVVGLRSANHAVLCSGVDEAFCVLSAIRDHVELSLTSLGGIISPDKLVDNLSYFSPYFQRYQQEDAHEFMQCFLDKLERCLKSAAKDKISSEDDGLVNNVFGGRLMSKLCCCNCGHCSQTYEPLVDMSLEIEDADSLSSALESFTRVEKIEDPETKFKCENCKKEVLVEKQLKLDKIPLVVAFHLKRFKTDGSSVEKIDKHIEFPFELDLQQYTMGSQDSKDCKYELYAIVVHNGFSSSSGHYISFVRSSPDTWHRMDDSKVSRVTEDYVLSQEAYILLFKRKGSLWFSNLIEHQNSCLGSGASNPSPNLICDNIDKSSPNLNSAEFCGEIGEKERSVNDLENISSNNLPTIDSVKTKSSHVNEPMIEAEYNDGFHCLTPPGSPSPDINIFQTPEPQYCIPVDHLKIEKCTTSGRPTNTASDDSERKEALRYIKKSMPGSRGSRMIAALLGTQSEGSLNKKKRMRSSPCKRSSPPSNRRKTGHNFVRFVAAEN